MNRTLLLDQIHYTERFIEAGAEALQKPPQLVQRLDAEGKGNTPTALTAHVQT